MALFIMTVAMLFSNSLQAQEEILPKGIGLYQFGYRSYSLQTQKYNNDGELEALGAPFTQDFTGQNLRNGAGGTELKRLADELAKYDSFLNSENSLVNQLNLGSMSGEVEANIAARIFGLAFGAGNNLSIFAGIPYIDAEVKTSIEFRRNPADVSAIKSNLGNLAFDEIQNGLDRAATISTEQIIQSIESNGYAPIDHWAYSGWGDLQVGTIAGGLKKYRSTIRKNFYSLKTTVNVPTGYYEDPNILTDVSLGKGYWGVNNEWTQSLLTEFGLWGGYRIGFGYNFDTQVEKRVPEANEGVVSQDRLAEVDFDPGHDLSYATQVGWRLGAIRTRYQFGYKRHYRDSYSGNLVGNYDKLSEESDSYQTYHQASLILQTMDLYQRKKFPIPFQLELTGNFPIDARNSQDEQYYELRLASFFSTPMARYSKRNKRDMQMKKARKAKKRKRFARR